MRAGIEAGGTKFVCLVGTGPEDVIASGTIPTTTPRQTLDRVRTFLHTHNGPSSSIEAVGIAAFGPLDLQHSSPSYGRIRTTPKVGWAGTDLVGAIREALPVPVGIDTDVNGAALGERRWGATQGLQNSVYVTVGTGIGGGGVIEGRPLHGFLHPEMGHILVRRHPEDRHGGSCPLHGDCLEGLASGSAVEDRLGQPAQNFGVLPHPLRGMLAWYLGQLVTTIAYVLSPERIVIGGGVLKTPGILKAIREQTLSLLGGATDAKLIIGDMHDYLVPPQLGDMSGALGALDLADRALGVGR